MSQDEGLSLALKIAYNVLLLLVCMGFSVALIQHAAFFYSFPPDFSRWVSVSHLTYVFLGLILWFALKLQHFIAEKSQFVEDEG